MLQFNCLRRKKFNALKIFLPIVGLVALIWFLVRVIPKPSRLLYPCQRVATPIATGFIAWVIFSAIGSTTTPIINDKTYATRFPTIREREGRNQLI